MGALISKAQVESVKEQVAKIAKTAQMVYGNLDEVNTIGADAKKGAFMSPILLREDHPMTNTTVHEVEAFGPVSTIMPYQDLDEAITLAQMGKGSLVSSIFTYDDKIARDYVVGAAVTSRSYFSR